MEKLNGVWKLKSSEKFDQYMKELGVDFATRKIGSLAKPKVTVDVQDSVFYLKSENTFKTFEIKCSLGEEFDEAAVDGRKCKSIVTWDGSKLVHVQRWNEKESTINRHIDENGDLVMECVIGDVKSIRVYAKA